MPKRRRQNDAARDCAFAWAFLIFCNRVLFRFFQQSLSLRNAIKAILPEEEEFCCWKQSQRERLWTTTLAKKKNHPRDSRREERCSTCDIMLDQRRAKVADSHGSDLPCADRAWSSMISHVEQRSSRRESRWWFFFLARVVVEVHQSEEPQYPITHMHPTAH